MQEKETKGIRHTETMEDLHNKDIEKENIKGSKTSLRFNCSLKRSEHRRSDEIEKSTGVIRMNKARAYRELQRRQAKYTKLWTEGNPLTQSVDCNTKENNRRNFADQSSVRDGELVTNLAPKLYGNMQTLSHHPMDNRLMSQPRQPGSSYIFTVNDRDYSRTLARARSSKTNILYGDSTRPVTAPETSAFATLDGPRIERIGKTQSVKSDGSESESVRELRVKTKAKGFLTRSSIDCNNVNPLLRDQNIQYPLASKMREILANDGRLIQQAPGTSQTPNANNGRTLVKRESTTSLLSRGSSLLPGKSAKLPTNNAVLINKNNNSNLVTYKCSTLLRPATSKQVSFQDGSHQGLMKGVAATAKTIETEGPLSLTAKNLEMLNNMVLKTMRTSKFDERVVSWVKERQFDGSKSKNKLHHPIPEVVEEESMADGGPNSSTNPQPTKKTSRDKTFHVQHESLKKSTENEQTFPKEQETITNGTANVDQVEGESKPVKDVS